MSPPLKYVEADIAHFADVISSGRCRYRVIDLSNHIKADALRQALLEKIDDCEIDDEIIWYFAGHGKLFEGALYLILNESDVAKPRSTCLPAKEIVEALQSCKASKKIIILDCCHAGGAVAGFGFRDADETKEKLAGSIGAAGSQPDGLVVLCAGDVLERAREVEELKHGFLTYVLCEALTSDFRNAADHEIRLTVGALVPYLARRARRHNKNNQSAKVPIPVCFGKHRDEIYLTADPHQFFPHIVPWCHGTTMALLPIKPVNGKAFLIGTSLVTNRLFASICYSKFPAPPWDSHIEGGPSCHDPRRPGTFDGRLRLSGPPLETLSKGSGYSDPDQPTVAWSPYRTLDFIRLFEEKCDIPSHKHGARLYWSEWQTTIEETKAFNAKARASKRAQDPPLPDTIIENCKRGMWERNYGWAPWNVPGHYNMLPSSELWDLAAFEDEPTSVEPLRGLCRWGESTSLTPESTVDTGSGNWLGVSQVFGNLWQICSPFGSGNAEIGGISSEVRGWHEPAELRGGSFLERASVTPRGIPSGRWRVILSESDYSPSGELWVKGIANRCDVGLRLAAMIPVTELPTDIQEALDGCAEYRELGLGTKP